MLEFVARIIIGNNIINNISIMSYHKSMFQALSMERQYFKKIIYLFWIFYWYQQCWMVLEKIIIVLINSNYSYSIMIKSIKFNRIWFNHANTDLNIIMWRLELQFPGNRKMPKKYEFPGPGVNFPGPVSRNDHSLGIFRPGNPGIEALAKINYNSKQWLKK